MIHNNDYQLYFFLYIIYLQNLCIYNILFNIINISLPYDININI